MNYFVKTVGPREVKQSLVEIVEVYGQRKQQLTTTSPLTYDPQFSRIPKCRVVVREFGMVWGQDMFLKFMIEDIGVSFVAGIAESLNE